jgi:hypothetical protein
MNRLKLLSIPMALFCLTSCAISKYTAPPFTDLDKILDLKTGQTIKEVSETLKIKPYDIVYSHEKGRKILIYNYRLKDRRMPLPTKTAAQVTHGEASQRSGELWYNTNYRELYLLFQDDKLKSIFGEEVLFGGAVSIEALDSHVGGGNPANKSSVGTNDSKDDLLYARGVYQTRLKNKDTELSEDLAAKKRRNFLIGGGIVGVLALLNLFR